MHRHLWIFSIIVLLNACKDRSAPQSVPPAPPVPTVSTAPKSVALPEFIEAARSFEEAVAAKDMTTANEFFDKDTFCNTVTAGVPARKDFRESMVATLKDAGFSGILSSLGQGEWRLLQVYVRDGRTHALFRSLANAFNCNYHLYTLRLCDDGKVRADDIFIVGSGEYLTQTLRRLYILSAAEANKDGPAPANSILSHADHITKIGIAMRERRFADVVSLCDSLPPNLQQEKLFSLSRVACLAQLSGERPEEYKAAFADYEKRFPDDPSLQLMSLDAFRLARNFSAYYRAVERLERWTGGDNFLVAQHAQVLMEENKPAAAVEAEKMLRKVLASEPKLQLGHWVMIQALALQGKHDAAVESLQTFERIAGATTTDVDLRNTKSLTNSEPYRNYRNSQKP